MLLIVSPGTCLLAQTATHAQIRNVVPPVKKNVNKTGVDKALVGKTAAADAATIPFDADAALNKLITQLVLKHMPHTYSKDKEWGQQSERWDGIKWERQGLRLKTKRRKKKVNHGTWRKYSAALVDPKHQFDVQLTDIRRNADKKLAFRVMFTSKIKLHARQSEWVKGVQLYSLSADGYASVRLTVDMVLGITLDPTHFPPDLVFSPKATSAEILVDDFRIDRISKLGGEFAQQITQLARRQLDDEVAEKEKKLVEKINKEIQEDPEKLRLSLSEALDSKWAEKTRRFLPPAIKKAIDSHGK